MNFDKILIAVFFFPQNNLFMLHSNRIKLTPSKCPSQQAETRPGPGRSNRPRDRSWRWKTRCWIPEKLIDLIISKKFIYDNSQLTLAIQESRNRVRVISDYVTRIRNENTRELVESLMENLIATLQRIEEMLFYITIVIGNRPLEIWISNENEGISSS